MNDQESLRRGMCGEVVGNGTHQMLVMAVEINRLQALVDKLPKTADEVAVVPGMPLYLPGQRGPGAVEDDLSVNPGRDWPNPPRQWGDAYKPWKVSDCYSTREAAEAAEAERVAEMDADRLAEMENKVEP